MKVDVTKLKKFVFRNGYLLIISAWLITLSFLVNNYWWYISSPSHVQELLEDNIQRRENKFFALSSDTTLMYKLLNRDYDNSAIQKYTGNQQDFYLYFFKGDWGSFWTSNQIAIDSSVLSLKEGTYFRKLKSGYYEIIRKNLDSQNHVFAFIPIKKQYYFSNRYLSQKYYQLPRISNDYKINQEKNGYGIHSVSGDILFYIQNTNQGSSSPNPWLSGVLLGLAIIFVNIFLNQFAIYIGSHSKPWLGFGFLCLAFVILRGFNYLNIFSLGFNQYELFDSTIYASNYILKSLGDLLINVGLMTWLILYAYNRLRKHIHITVKLSKWKRYLLMFLSNAVLFYLVYLSIWLIKGLVINSKISFDVTDFFSLDIYSFVGFLVLGLLGFSFYFFIPILNRLQLQLCNKNLLEKIVVLGGSGFLWLIIQLFIGTADYSLWVMFWGIGYLYIIDWTDYWLRDRYKLERFILLILILTVSITFVVVHYNAKRELGYRKQLVIKLTEQKEPTLIFNLSIIDTAMVNDPAVISYYENYNDSDEQELKEYVLNKYFSGFQNKYDFTIYTAQPRDSLGEISREKLRLTAQTLIGESDFTDFRYIFFNQTSISNYYYIAALPVWNANADSLLGLLSYQMAPKAVKPESLYPELLMQRQDYEFKNALKDYSYAVYDDRNLVYHQNSYPFPIMLDPDKTPEFGFKSTELGDYSILKYRASDHKVIVMIRENKDFLEAMTLFAYLFGVFLLLVLLFNLSLILFNSRLKWHNLKTLMRLNIRNRVYAIIVFIVVFVFVVLGMSTIQFFINRYNVQQKNRLDYEINSLLPRIQEQIYSLSQLQGQYFFNINYNTLLKNKIQNVAKQENIDINIYDLDGNLRISTQNLIYKNGLLSRKMEPSAYYDLQFLHQVQVTQKEQVGNLIFLSSYVPIRSKDGALLAFLNLPKYSSQSALQLEISNFLVTLINLNAFIFLLAGLLALLFTHSITGSFALIIEKLKNVKLNGKNEEIDWEYDDEIGRLVAEYNSMVHKLEESAEKLARSEREGAWRKMARQVAHEIKNPLTPMKLSLQHLQYSIKNDSPRKDQLTQDVAQTIIEQIEHLTQIASDFSAFANITYARNEVLVLNDILASVVSLHHGYENIDLDYEVLEERLELFADKTQINRVFTNIIQNAMQSIPDNRRGLIRVEMRREDDFVVVKVADNGEGIEKDVRERIFTPNFTTKSSGTGLGLAISKNIVQRCGGDIWFETEIETGTTFYVKLPLRKKEK